MLMLPLNASVAIRYLYIAHKLGYFGLHYSMSTIIVRRGVLECTRLGLFSGPVTVIE